MSRRILTAETVSRSWGNDICQKTNLHSHRESLWTSRFTSRDGDDDDDGDADDAGFISRERAVSRHSSSDEIAGRYHLAGDSKSCNDSRDIQ